MHTRQTITAYRQTRDIQQRQAANAAVGRKQDVKEPLSTPLNPTLRGVRKSLSGNNRTPSYYNAGLASADSVLTTAEDSLLDFRGENSTPQTVFLHQQYSGDPGA
jgi:hypothetical protein